MLEAMIGKHIVYESGDQEWEHSSNKRRKVSNGNGHDVYRHVREGQERPRSGHDHNHGDNEKERNITIASTAHLASQAVAPFFAKHIPSQYAPLGYPKDNKRDGDRSKDPNTKYCYRHRPDMLCRKQADETTMDKMQKELEALSPEDRQGIVHVWSLFSAAPSRYRNLMLQGILSQCCFPQLSFLSANVRELIRIDFLSALPSEIAFRILCFLDTTSLCKAAQVSRRWRQLADDDVVWHRMCEQHIDRKCTRCGWGLPLLERKRLREYKRQVQLRASGHVEENGSVDQAVDNDGVVAGQSVAETAASSHIEKKPNGKLSPVLARPPLMPTQSEFERKTRPWKDVYKDRFKVGTNWKHGRSKLEILKGHTNGVMALDMWDNILATGSYDDTIKIWDMDTGKELRTLRGHTMGIRCLQISATTLVSGSLDNHLRSWNWRTGQCIGVWKGHTDGVIGLHHNSEVMVSGSIDKTVRVWNLKNKSVSVLRGHGDWVNSVRIDTPSRTVFTASDDCTVKLWDLDTNECIRTYEGHVCQVQQVIILPAEFDAEEEEEQQVLSDPSSPDTAGSSYSGHGTGSPVLTHANIQAARMQQLSDVDPFANFDPERPRPPRYMLTSALDTTIRLWEISTGRCVRTFFGHLEGVWALAADTLRIVSGAEDSMVKVWDPRSGKCERTFTGHRGPVTCVALSDSRMVSAGEDGDIRVYSYGN